MSINEEDSSFTHSICNYSEGDQIEEKILKESDSLEDLEDDQNTSKSCSASVPPEQPYFLQYQRIMSDALDHRPLNQLISELETHGISYNRTYTQQQKHRISQNQLKINSIKSTRYFQIVVFSLSLGPFTQNLTIYNTFSDFFSYIGKKYVRQDSNIHFFHFNLKDYVLKSTELWVDDTKNLLLNHKKLFSVLKECFFAKIASALKIGPKIATQFGFDIFVSKGSCFFIMEFCQPSFMQKLTNFDALKLKQHLKELHLLSIVHRDIKSDNIMYSPCYKKFVFIDFGYSYSIQQTANQVVETGFVGTYAYASKEMKKLFENHEIGWINIHFNDAYGLQVSIKEMLGEFKFNHLVKELNDEESQQKTAFANLAYEVIIKYGLFIKKCELVNEIGALFDKIPDEIVCSIMRFFYEIGLNEQIRDFYRIFLKGNPLLESGFQDLKEILETKTIYQFCQGKRKMTKFQREEISKVKQFYEEIHSEKSPNLKLQKISVKDLQNVVFSKNLNLLQRNNSENSNNNELTGYFRYLINYLNVKRIEPLIQVSKKLEACEIYLTWSNVKIDAESAKEVLQFTFRHILTRMTIEMKIMNFDEYVRGLENYYILTENVDPQILDDVVQVLQFIVNVQFLSLLQKLEYSIMLLYVMSSIRSKCWKVTTFRKMTNIKNLVFQKMNFYLSIIQNDMSDNDKETCRIYQICFGYFEFEPSMPRSEYCENLLQRVSNLKPWSSHSSILLNYVQYKLVERLQFMSEGCFQLIQRLDTIIQEMEAHTEFNASLPKLIQIYFNSKELSILRKLLSIYDDSLQIQCINRPFARYMIVASCQKFDKSLSLQKNFLLNKLETEIINSFQINADTLLIFQAASISFGYMIQRLEEEKISAVQLQVKVSQIISQNISQLVTLYESLGEPLQYRGSKNLLYLNFLLRETRYKIQLENRLDHNFNNLKDKQNLKKRDSCFQIDCFQKIFQIDRTNFNDVDHVFVLSTDIQWIRYKNGQFGNKAILEYMRQKKSVITQILNTETIFQKVCILSAFSLMFSFLNDSCNPSQTQMDESHSALLSNQDNIFQFQEQKKLLELNEFIKFVYPIVSKKYFSVTFNTDFSVSFVTALIKTNKFKELINEVVESSKYYTNHFSNSNIYGVIHFFTTVITCLASFDKQKIFYDHLKEFLDSIDLKKFFVLNVFLLFCIKSFNRMSILKLILKNLAEIKYNTKELILSRFYKELMKVDCLKFVRKRNVLSRRDVRYGSENLKTLDQMKRQIDQQRNWYGFNGIHLEKAERKIVKLGQCCEVYCERKGVKHPMHKLMNHAFLDGQKITRETELISCSQNHNLNE